MANQYISKYLKTYVLQGIAVVLGFVSMFVVTPFISSDVVVFGVYSVCISLSIFFSYADLGIGSAGQKFAAEYFKLGKKDKEIGILGFVLFTYLVFMGLISLAILFLAIDPDILIKNIAANNIAIARSLLVTLALSSPIMAMQRTLTVVYNVRLEDYKFQRIVILGTVLKILSVFWFFRDSVYDIVGYYICFQLITLSVVVAGLSYAIKKYEIDFHLLILSIKPNRRVFTQVRGLAGASLVSMICWVLYYELDQIAIGALLGAKQVAIYAIAFSVLSLFRTFFSVLYSPYTSRLNYFTAENDFDGLNRFVNNLIYLFYPVVVFPIIIVALCAEPFLLSWVGKAYEESALLCSILVCCNLFAYYVQPANAYLYVCKMNYKLIVSSMLTAFIYWIGIIVLYKVLDIVAFPIMKVVAIWANAFFVIIVMRKQVAQKGLISSLIKGYVPSTLVCCIFAMVVAEFMYKDKSTTNLLINVCVMGVVIIVSFTTLLLTNKSWRNISYSILKCI